ncbi:MAG: PKD domain-containing protein [Saprospiraceae bacterium]|nr:PKD domain-containing protein [Saprospiraceae bacterium]MBP9210092.1 PKD domain-containing protein [Saprospiraceae bacterium]
MHYNLRWTAGFVALVFPFIFACDDDGPGSEPDSGKIQTEQTVPVGEHSIGSPGGTITVDAPGSPVEGLEIEVPAGAYPSARTFKIAYAPITSHEFGELFQPVSPLIEISNGGGLADQMMRLRVPVEQINGGQLMGFYYDRKTGLLEGIPIVATGEGYIDLAVRHFSWVVVTEIQKELLIGGGAFDTGFNPSRNGWSFTNYGTFPEARGICAGMSIAAAHYFKNFSSTVDLYSYFDNNQELWFRTEDIWEDDSKGLQFATAIHRVYGSFWQGNNTSILGMINAPEEERFWNIIFNLLILNQPQLLYVQDSRSDTSHCIAAFAYTIDEQMAKIRVYDPNYPGSEGTIEFDIVQKKFKPYTTAANAVALEQGSVFHCDIIAYQAFSAVMSTDEMDFLWKKVQNNTIGEGLFPSYKIYAQPKDPEYTKVELKPIGKNGYVNSIPFDVFDFVAEGLDASFSLTAEGMSYLPGFGLERIRPMTTMEMNLPDTLFGYYLKGIPPGAKDPSWIGFHWFRIRKQQIWIEPADTIVAVQAEVPFIARNNGSAPKHARYSWDFGDGHDATSSDTIITYKFPKEGEYTVTLKVTDLDRNVEVAEAQTTIAVTRWPKIAITIRGMDAQPPSTMKASDGSDIPAIAWANKWVATAPAIRWNEQQFETEFTYNLYPGTYTCRISGNVSADFKKVEYVSAIYSGTAFDGDWLYYAAVVLRDFPLEVYIPGEITGKILTGPDAQSKVAQLSWKQVYNAQVDPKEITLQSVDWSSPQTELSIFFYNE